MYGFVRYIYIVYIHMCTVALVIGIAISILTNGVYLRVPILSCTGFYEVES